MIHERNITRGEEFTEARRHEPLVTRKAQQTSLQWTVNTGGFALEEASVSANFRSKDGERTLRLMQKGQPLPCGEQGESVEKELEGLRV